MNDQLQLPYADLLKGIVSRIKAEPFLFVVSIAIILLATAAIAARSASVGLISIIIVAGLAFTAIVGYYGLELSRSQPSSAEACPPIDAASIAPPGGYQ